MEATEQTLHQIDRALGKVIAKFPASQEASVMTDLRLRVSPESGEFLTYDDDDKELNRCVVDQWIECKDESFYDSVAKILRQSLQQHADELESMSILRPFSFILENDDSEQVAELYLVDDDTVIIDEHELMEGLSDDLDSFLQKLMND